MDLPTLGAKALEGCWCRREFIDWLHRLVFCVLSINSTGDDDGDDGSRGRSGNTVKRAGQWFGLLLLRMNALLCFALCRVCGTVWFEEFPRAFLLLVLLLVTSHDMTVVDPSHSFGYGRRRHEPEFCSSL